MDLETCRKQKKQDLTGESMDGISKRFIDKLFGMTTVSDSALDKSRECFADYLSVMIAGSARYKDRNSGFISKNHLEGKHHIVGMKEMVDIRTAVMINAFNAHFLELDDSHRVAMTHLGAPIFSAVLGVAEIHNNSVNEVLMAAIVGYEAAIRVASAIQPSHKKRGFHVSGTCCTIGAAMAIASMLRYTKEEMNNVLCAACTSAGGLLGASSDDSEQKPYNIANAAVAGLNAALYGKYFKGAKDILGDPRGFLNAMSDTYDEGKLFEKGYAIETIYQKLYAACRHCHAPMEAMLNIQKREELDATDIEDITVRVYDLAIKGHDHTEIMGMSSAKQSIPYGVAVACVCQDCGMRAFSEKSIEDERILTLAKKVKLVEDKELTALVPRKRAAIVEVRLKDGRTVRERVDYAKGEPENPITKDEFKQKFTSLVESAGMTTGEEILSFVNDGTTEPVSRLFQWI